MLTWLAAMWWMRWGMVMVPAEDEPALPAPLPPELTGDGLRDMGEGVSVLLQEGKETE